MKSIRVIGVVSIFLAAAHGASAAEPGAASASPNYKLTQQAAAPVYNLPAVAARVNGVDILTDQVWNRLVASAGNTVLTTMVDDILVQQEGDKRIGNAAKGKKSKAAAKIESDISARLASLKKQFQDEAAFQKQMQASGLKEENLKNQIRLDLYKEMLLEDRIKVTPQEAKTYFDENRKQLAVPEQVRLRHILVSSEQEARDLSLALKVGAKFDLLAKEKSLDEATKNSGGELGFFGSGMLTEEIQGKVFSLPAGGLDVVKTGLGWHVIQVVERKPAKDAEWNDETRNKIEQALRQAKFGQEYPKYMQELRAKSDIKIFLNQ